jgi:hypothetical protein
MVKTDKREQRIRGNTRNVSLEDFEWLINRHGYIKGGGTHLLAIIGKSAYPYRRTNPMHPAYVKGLLALIDREEL